MTEINKIKERFKDKPFKVEELSEFLDISDRSSYLVIDGLLDNGELIKVAAGVYKFGEKREFKPSKYIETLRKKLLKSITRRFKFTALSVLESFIHHIPYVISYHLFVEKGSAEDFESELKKIDPKVVILIEPSKEDIHLLIRKTNANKFIVIRENNYFLGSEEGLASPETAFIDLYFETTRDKIPFMKTDLKEIFKDLIMNNLINYSKLIPYAHERKLSDEIKDFVLNLSKVMEFPEGGLDVLRKVPER